MLRRSFHGLSYLSVAHFRWLKSHRKLGKYRIRMLVHYEERDYLASFVHSVLEARYALELRGLKNGAESLVLKLFLNRSVVT